MRTFHLHDRFDWFASVAASSVASVAILGAAAMLFVEDGRTPWFDAESRLARRAQSCEPLRAGSKRHACLREVARTARDVPLAAGTAAPFSADAEQ